MADRHSPSYKAQPYRDFGCIMLLIRKQIDGRDVERLGKFIGRSRSWLGRVEVGETSPVTIDDETIQKFLAEVEQRLNELGHYKKKERRFHRLIKRLYKVYDRYQDEYIAQELERLRKSREKRKYGKI